MVYNDSNAIKNIDNNSLPFTILQKATLLSLIYHLENGRKERGMAIFSGAKCLKKFENHQVTFKSNMRVKVLIKCEI